MARNETEQNYLATFIVRQEDNPKNLPVGAEFTEPIRGFDELDALDCHGGFTWAEYLHATAVSLMDIEHQWVMAVRYGSRTPGRWYIDRVVGLSDNGRAVRVWAHRNGKGVSMLLHVASIRRLPVNDY